MSCLDLQSETFRATGNIAAEGAIRSLGRPDMDLLTLLVRETIQNSWDARLSDVQPVRYAIDMWAFSRSQRAVLVDEYFAERPDEGLPLPDELEAERLVALTISDRNTLGLAGPTRADRALVGGAKRNFVDFMRNIGRPHDAKVGGGTYGYGKASLYLASRAHTICVYTRPEGAESRLMAAALGRQYEGVHSGQRRRFTGRHWWGQRASDGIVDPLFGDAADEIAEAIGLPKFSGDETGTTVLVIQPNLGDRTLHQAANFMALQLLWYAWPKILPLDSRGAAPMEVSVTCEHGPVQVPDPAEFPPLKGFARAMQNLRQSAAQKLSPADGVLDVEIFRPKKHLGRLALERTFFSDEVQVADVGETDGNDASGFPLPINRPPHHVALMREPELVVRYLEGDPPPTDAVGYAGVFLADDELNHVFAEAEPPTHDDWSPETLEEKTDRSCVRVALRRVQEHVREFLQPELNDEDPTSAIPLGAFSKQMGSLVPDSEGPGAEVQPQPESTPGGGSRRTRARIKVLEDELALVDGRAAVIVHFEVEPASDTSETIVEASPEVMVMDGRVREKDAPVGGDHPEVIAWFSPEGTRYEADNRVAVPADSRGNWAVQVRVPETALVRVNLSEADEED